MKNFQLSVVVFIFGLLCFSCSDEKETILFAEDEELVNLSLNIDILGLSENNSSRQQIEDFPICIPATPYYIEIIMMQAGREVVGTSDAPFRIDLAPNQMFTRYVPEMALPAGDYYLDHCAVFTEDGTLMCLAPRFDSPMGRMSAAPMPMSINLVAGSKPFPDVPVLCFDDRDVNEFGYQFFDIQPTLIRNFCFFANYCSDSGRHYPARYELDISVEGVSVYRDIISTNGEENGEYYADPVCVDLPIILDYEEDEKYIDYTLRLLEWEGVYEVDEEMVFNGSLSRADINEKLSGDNIEYEHIFFNCQD
ncbi:hypothetical protein MKO06_02745 [Gramella sp. GC03-9]|uniref:Uncharacterized protein n=1 Tax=Christiangramia oceanisediminis TaxID=2920386 RepID=A0A9X2KV43_9FLAO|nr:hypothetical protein [Gramella oceanisediminis]MCP9198807.1 hypothetical protein [Gramella oceanisediminis]